MFCPNCGKDFKSKEVNFCPDCGKNLSDFKDAELEKQSSQPIEKTNSEKSIQDHTLSKSKIANEVIDEIVKGDIPGTKAESDKKLGSTNHLSELNKKETSSLTKKIPKQRKWGWGWYILFGFVFMGINKTYGHLGDNKGILVLIGVALSLVIYFYLRNKVFSELSSIYQRSFVSGFISFIFTALVVGGVAGFINTSQRNINTSQRNVFNELSAEVKEATLIADKKMKEYNLLMEDFVYEPSIINDGKNNILISEKTLVISNFVDSVALSMYRRIYDDLLSVENNNPKIFSGSKINSALIQTIIEKLITYSLKNRTSTQALIDYYNAWIDESPEQDELWNIYEEELEKFTVAENEYFELYTHFTQLAEK